MYQTLETISRKNNGWEQIFMEEHLHSEGVRCPRQGGGGGVYYLCDILHIYQHYISRTYICDVETQKSFRKYTFLVEKNLKY